jgi:hypothetical protein
MIYIYYYYIIKFKIIDFKNIITYFNMVKAPIKVIIRTRPTVNYASKNIDIDEASGKITVNIPKQAESG